MDSFDSLPLAAKVLSQFFCVNSGIDNTIASSPAAFTTFNRFVEVPLNDTWAPIVWAVPNDAQNVDTREFPHGAFKPDLVKALLKTHQCDYLIRSKQLIMEGYKETENMINIWSAPNFNGWIQNSAAAVQIVTPPSSFSIRSTDNRKPYVITHFRARPESLRSQTNNPPFQDVHSLNHIYIKHLPRINTKT